MSNEVRIKTSVTGNGKQEIQSLRDAWQKFQKEGSVGVKAGLTAAAAAKGFSLLDTAISGAAGVMSSAVGKASDLNETMSKSGVVFGTSADQVSKWGDKAAESLGLSKQQAIEAAATFGNLFKNLGQTDESAAKMSESLIGLAGDLASFNNIDPSEALEKLRSGLSGEAEPLRTVGVFLTEAKVKAKAMELGLAGAHGELTEGAKVMARYQLILDETTSAQGDFARTSDGLANKQRINQAKLDDALAKLGNILLPLVTDAAGDAAGALDGLSGVLDVLNGNLPETNDGWDALGKTINSLNPMTWAFGKAMDNAREKMDDAAKSQKVNEENLKRLGETTEETRARLAALGETADTSGDKVLTFGGIMDDANKAADGAAGAILDVVDNVRAAAHTSRDARDDVKDLQRALDDLTSSADDASRAFGDQKFSADELKGRIAELTGNLRDAKAELQKLEKIKHPTKSQQEDIDIARGKVAGYRHDLFNTRLDLAKLDKTQLNKLLIELAAAQYRTDKLGDEAREALTAFQKLSYAEKKVTGSNVDPGYAPRAGGGRVEKGQAYLVGEKRPELFVPDQSGTIIPSVPSMAMGSGMASPSQTVVVQFHAALWTPALMEQVRRELKPILGL